MRKGACGGVGCLHQSVAEAVVRAKAADGLLRRMVFGGREAAFCEAGGEGGATAVREGDSRVAAKGKYRVATCQKVFGGGRSFDIYSIHQIEMEVVALGVGACSVTRLSGCPTDIIFSDPLCVAKCNKVL